MDTTEAGLAQDGDDDQSTKCTQTMAAQAIAPQCCMRPPLPLTAVMVKGTNCACQEIEAPLQHGIEIQSVEE